MNEQAIKKLQNKFIIFQTLSLITVMFLISIFIYLFNVRISSNRIHETIDFILSHDGIVQDAVVIYDRNLNINQTLDSEFLNQAETYNIGVFLQEIFGLQKNNFELEKYSFSMRYFYVEFDETGEISQIIKNHINDLSKESAEQLGTLAMNSYFSFGNYGDYYYQCRTNEDGSTSVIYLESAEDMFQNRRLLFSALTIELIGILLTFLLVKTLSKKAIAPEIRAAELQKRFITDVSHELKTPLAVIKANTEMEEIISGENEWTQSTLRQVDRMSRLIKDLVTISKFEEKSKKEFSDTNISDLVSDIYDTFSSVAKRNDLVISKNISDNIHMMCSGDDIRQLVSILVDNAIKYCDEHGNVLISLTQKSKKITITVSNSYKDGKNVDYDKFFERFYREDKSRNIDKGGYGIGLSIAQEIVNNYKGSIKISWDNGIINFIVTFK